MFDLLENVLCCADFSVTHGVWLNALAQEWTQMQDYRVAESMRLGIGSEVSRQLQPCRVVSKSRQKFCECAKHFSGSCS